MSGPGSVTDLIDELRSLDPAARDEAAEAIWRRYSCRLLELARQHLAPRVRQREDEEDVLQNMYYSFCRRLGHGEFALEDRNDLWSLLVTMTINKVRRAATRHTRQRRSVHREQAGAAGKDDDSSAVPGGAARAEDSAPGPVEAAELTEMLQQLLHELSDPRQRQIVLWKLEGYTNGEIAGKLGCVVRTVERKLNLIREKWAAVS